MNYVATFLSKFISAYCKYFSTNHVLILLIENWKKPLDKKTFVGIVSVDLSKAFDSIPHDFLIGKMYGYRLSINTVVTFFYSCLKGWIQNVRINNTHNVFQVLSSGVALG